MRSILLLLPSALAACVTATPDCTEQVPLAPAGWTLVYRTHPLGSRNTEVARAVVMVHGAGRNADDYFRTAVAAAFLAGALRDTVVVAPRFASRDGGTCADKLAEGEVSYPCSGQSWRSGGAVKGAPGATSFHLMDQILRKLADRAVFPNLKSIVLTGHSAGGQFASRYAMSNNVHESLGVPVRYVVSNPSSYAYPEATRPSGECTDEGCAGFRTYREGENCTTFNRWPYGLEQRQGYAGQVSDLDLKSRLVSRPTTYLMGTLDTLPIAGFDGSCPAMAQGVNRYQRARGFWQLLRDRYQAKQEFVPVPLCGHNSRCVYTSDPALAVLFPRQ
jgi:pimeloyl-ACP methyl ester carboxylesterase